VAREHVKLKRILPALIFLMGACCAVLAIAAEPAFVEVRRYDAPEAVQAVPVDAEHFYAIGDDVIGKYSKASGQFEKRWRSTLDVALSHLDLVGYGDCREAVLRKFDLSALSRDELSRSLGLRFARPGRE
jgi:hypothetical protein